jgi:hypothetical protein
MRGGLRLLAVQDKEFKYTRSPQRIKWMKTLFPIGQYLIQIVRKIPWTSYEFKGNVDLFHLISEDDATFDPTKPDEYVAEEVPIQTRWTMIQRKVEVPIIEPYYFFGGCVYEIINTLIPDPSIPLRNYVDPTGDIDIRLYLPFIETPPDGIDYINYHLKADGTMNELLSNYTQWLMQQLEIQLKGIPKPLFDKLFENTVSFDFREQGEALHSDLQIAVGNLWIVRVPQYDAGMIKIQVVCKFEETEAADHCLEFVMRINTIPKVSNLNETILNLNDVRMFIKGFPLESFRNLLGGNLSGMEDRAVLYSNEELRHKLYNHVGRIQYLNIFFSLEKNHGFILGAPQITFANGVLQLLHYFIGKREAGELRHFSHDGTVLGNAYTDDVMMVSLLSYLIRFVFPKMDTTKPPLIKSVQIDRVRVEVLELLAKFHVAGSAPAGGGRARKTMQNRRRKKQQTRKRRQRKIRR